MKRKVEEKEGLLPRLAKERESITCMAVHLKKRIPRRHSLLLSIPSDRNHKDIKKKERKREIVRERRESEFHREKDLLLFLNHLFVSVHTKYTVIACHRDYVHSCV